MILKPSPVSTRQFTRDPSDRLKFIAEISDLGKSFQFGRVYDDACDIGLTLISEWTGVETVFAIHEEIKDGEGDVTGWELRPVPRQ
jgi:hypothetical protein